MTLGGDVHIAPCGKDGSEEPGATCVSCTMSHVLNGTNMGNWIGTVMVFMVTRVPHLFVCGRDSFVEGVWLVPVVGLVSILRALKALPFLRTLSISAGLGRLPGAVGVAAVLFERNQCLPKCRLASCNERSGGDWMFFCAGGSWLLGGGV